MSSNGKLITKVSDLDEDEVYEEFFNDVAG